MEYISVKFIDEDFSNKVLNAMFVDVAFIRCTFNEKSIIQGSLVSVDFIECEGFDLCLITADMVDIRVQMGL